MPFCRLLPILTGLLFSACAHSTIVPTRVDSLETSKLPPKPPTLVGVFRTHGPYDQFKELGSISYRLPYFDLKQIYSRLREDGARYGADAVIELDIRGESHYESRPASHCFSANRCNVQGSCIQVPYCRTFLVWDEVASYLAQGTLIRGGK